MLAGVARPDSAATLSQSPSVSLSDHEAEAASTPSIGPTAPGDADLILER